MAEGSKARFWVGGMAHCDSAEAPESESCVGVTTGLLAATCLSQGVLGGGGS